MSCVTAGLRATMRRRAAGCSSWMSRALWTSAPLRTISVHRPTRASAPAAASASPAAPAMSPTPSSSATWCGNASPSILRPQFFIMSAGICGAARPILQSPVSPLQICTAGVAHGQRAAVAFAVQTPLCLRHGTASCQMLPVLRFPPHVEPPITSVYTVCTLVSQFEGHFRCRRPTWAAGCTRTTAPAASPLASLPTTPSHCPSPARCLTDCPIFRF